MSEPLPISFARFHPIKCRDPFAIRMGDLYHQIVSRLAQAPQAGRETHDLHYVTMCHRNHFLMMRESLASLFRSWTKYPSKITVISDGSWIHDELKSELGWLPKSTQLQGLGRDEILTHLRTAGEVDIAEFGSRHHFNLKLAGILALASSTRILYVDSDILWFGEPAELIRDDKGTIAVASEEGTNRSYDPALEKKLLQDRRIAGSLISANTGMISINAKSLPQGWMQHACRIAIETMHVYSEQTIFAAAALLFGQILPVSVIETTFSDHKHVFPWWRLQRRPCARHYVNWMRHQFWRDALMLRLKLLPRVNAS